MTAKNVVAEEKVLKGTTNRVARATDPNRLHHTYMYTQVTEQYDKLYKINING